MKTLVLATALCLPIMAQNPTLIGLPDAKVDLVGTLGAPVIVNHSGTPIIGYVIKKYMGGAPGSGIGEAHINILYKSLARAPQGYAGILPGASEAYFTSTVPSGTSRTVTGLALDGVLFADGRYVGPDETKSWDKGLVQARVNGLRTIGRQLSLPGADLNGADEMAKPQVVKYQGKNMAERIEESAQYTAAREISEIRSLSGDDEAKRAAGRFSALPILWKEN